MIYVFTKKERILYYTINITLYYTQIMTSVKPQTFFKIKRIAIFPKLRKKNYEKYENNTVNANHSVRQRTLRTV